MKRGIWQKNIIFYSKKGEKAKMEREKRMEKVRKINKKYLEYVLKNKKKIGMIHLMLEKFDKEMVPVPCPEGDFMFRPFFDFYFEWLPEKYESIKQELLKIGAPVETWEKGIVFCPISGHWLEVEPSTDSITLTTYRDTERVQELYGEEFFKEYQQILEKLGEL